STGIFNRSTGIKENHWIHMANCGVNNNLRIATMTKKKHLQKNCETFFSSRVAVVVTILTIFKSNEQYLIKSVQFSLYKAQMGSIQGSLQPLATHALPHMISLYEDDFHHHSLDWNYLHGLIGL
ncbi:hypothetical protein ACJX0J_011129, partial [Zea mays]